MDKDTLLSRLWDEWLISPSRSRTSADYEVSGLLQGMKHKGLTFTTNRLRAARRLTGPSKVSLWQLTSYFERTPLSISMTTRPNHKTLIKFTIPNITLKLPKNRHTSWHWLKGLWGSAGSLYIPKTGYYLAIRIPNTEIHEPARYAFASTGLSWSEHGNEYTLRNHEDITTFLCNAGLPSGALEFDAIAMMRSVHSRVNRESNYDNANIARSLEAAQEQLRTAQKIISLGLLEKLPEKLQDLVKLRLEYPSETLSGLGNRLNPHITKASVSYRWRKIQSLLDFMEK